MRFVNGVVAKGDAADQVDAVAKQRNMVDMGAAEPGCSGAKGGHVIDDLGGRHAVFDPSEPASK